MFSPSLTNLPAPGTLRSSRRRQRPANEPSLSQPTKRQKRSALNEQTFLPPDTDGPPEMEEIKNLKTPMLPKHASLGEIPVQQREIAVRARKSRSGDRGNKGDGSVTLTTNDTYTVSKLPALPDRLRADITGRQHGAIYADSGYALTLTHTHAIVWPYAVNVPSPETFTFELPNPSKHNSDPLPLGSLVSASASSSEPGIVVVVPTSGKITYWECISSAATLDLRLQRNGVELSIPGMMSGETVIQILNAESAGFMLAFSTGRLAYMSVRDGQGRPAISVQFLRSGSGFGGSGIFGSLRNALSTSWRGDIAAARAGPSDRVGERNVVVVTSKGKVQSWNIQRGGHIALHAEAEGREAIVDGIKQAVPALRDFLLESFELHDFAYAPKPVASSQLVSQENNGVHLLLLTSLTDRRHSHYSLVEVILLHDQFVVANVRPIKCYTTPVVRNATSKPRLYLPNPALVAYAVFDRAVVVLSMAKQAESAESQLQAESHILPQAFEDVIDFREDLNVEIVGSGVEEPHGQAFGIDDTKSRRYKAKHPATVLIVRGGGVVRVAATDITKLVSSKAHVVTARSKLEQAVFFGTLERNPLSFAGRPEIQFPSDEVGAAALELSLDILKSRTSYIPSVPASIDQNLRKRSAALRDLADYLRASDVVLDRATKWKLLWDAEKMTAATLIWKRYDTSLKKKAVGYKRGLLTELVEFIHEDYKTEPVAEAGELDRVRHWFINDVWNLEVAVPWAYQVIKYTYQDGQKDHAYVMEILSEADDLVLSALKGAFDFRTANLDFYGLKSEKLKHGLLEDGFEGLPEFWTSSIYITENARKQAELAGLLVKEYWEKGGGEGQPDALVVHKVRMEHPALIDMAIRSNVERTRWDAAQDSPQLQIEGEQIKVIQAAAQDEQLTILATDIALPDEAMDLAEKHEILPTLASILLFELNGSTSKSRESGLEEDVTEYWVARTSRLHNRVRHCFDKFGANWATALYEYHINLESMADLLDQYPDKREYLTDFLRSKPEYAKVSWINEITREKNYDRAAKTLLDLGLHREQDEWSQRVELSMGKLARLAGRTYSETNGILVPDGGKTELASADSQLGLLRIQNQIYDYILPSIATALDEKAEIQLALEIHGIKRLKGQMTFLTFLEDGMARLVKHETMDALTLIDLLTLMDGSGRPEDEELLHAQQFYLALQATRYGLDKKDDRILAQRITWRRCMLKDDWAQVNQTDLKDDEEVSDQLRRTALYLTFRACLKNRLFDKDSVVKPINPEDVLGASTDELDHRFTGLDASIRERIMKAMQIEDDALQGYVDTCRLEKWYHGALELAKQDYEEELAEDMNGGQQMKKIEDKLANVEREIAEKELSKAQSLLHSRPRSKPKAKLNGHGNGASFRASIKQY